jgi:glycosyltransferase involved in cell wall biosynthesis
MNASELPLVTIVTPSFNQAQFLETTIQSVLSQDYPNVEYIVIDGGSTDGSVDIIQKYETQITHWISEPDLGQAHAINKGLKLANGEIVTWLNSDDVYLPGALSGAAAALQSDPDAGMVCGDGLMVDSQLRLLDRHYYRALSVVDLLRFEVVLQPATFMRRTALKAVGYLNDNYQLILDHELWVRIASHYTVLHVPSFWALERTHAQAKTIAQAASFVEEAERLVNWAAEAPELASVVAANQTRIEAGLNVFAARRLIDAGKYRAAVRRMLTAFSQHAPTVARYWYKAVQATLSAIGLARLFELYRTIRRRLLFRGRKVNWERDSSG